MFNCSQEPHNNGNDTDASSEESESSNSDSETDISEQDTSVSMQDTSSTTTDPPAGDPSWLWAKNLAQGVEGGTWTPFLAVAPDGSIYLAGSFRDQITFGATTLQSAGEGDLFLVKCTSQGEVIWARRGGGLSNYEGATSLAVSPDGSVYVTGTFSGDATFGSTTLHTSEFLNMYLIKYDATGEVLWAKGMGSDLGHDWSDAVVTLPDGSLYMSGTFSGSLQFDSITLDSKSQSATFVARFDANGEFKWAQSIYGIGAVASSGLGALADGTVYNYGSFKNDANIGSIKLSLVDKGTPIFPGEDVYLAKYNAQGEVQWAKSAGGDGAALARSLAIHADGSASISGVFHGNFSSGSAFFETTDELNVFVAKYSGSGEPTWAKQGSISAAWMPLSLVAGGDDALYLTGGFSGNFPFKDLSLTAVGTADLLLTKLSGHDGAVQWVKPAGGVDMRVVGNNLRFLPNGNLVVAAQSQGTYAPGKVAFDTIELNVNSAQSSLTVAILQE